MWIEVAEHARMSESGSSLLRLIQNNDTARLDLLVREALQNCLDAGDKDKRYDSVKVDFLTGSFDTEQIAPFFEKIDVALKQKYAGRQEYIAIKDSHTVGLTGPIRYDDVKNNQFGNLLKLVYEISKPQESSGAGGSWGLGKTVYFRIGAGLVLYYSRISDEKGKFSSRLAAALVEDETGIETLLPHGKGLQRGIAWWGDRDELISRSTIPLTNEKEINRILDGFGIGPYKEKETGTTIIIPFIDRKSLLSETVPLRSEAGDIIPYWCRTNIEEYIKIACQRWYAPRMNNKKYNGMYLDVSINGERVSNKNMAPVFQLVQKLYNSRPQQELEFNGKKVTSKVIEVRNVFKKGNAKAGWINYIQVTAEDMKMIAPDNLPGPYYYINKLSSDTMYNDPIVLYTRKPGMVVSYMTTGDWTDNIPKAAMGKFIIGIFVANSENILNESGISLEEYIRGSEKADHMSWNDWAVLGKNPQIITRIKRGVRKKIKDDYAAMTTVEGEKKNLGLGKMLAEFLLPPSGYTYWDDAKGGSAGPGGTGGDGAFGKNDFLGNENTTTHVILKQTGAVVFGEDGIQMPVKILFGKQSACKIEFEVDSERGSISGKDWEKNINTSFPVELIYFQINSIFAGKGKRRKCFLDESIKVQCDEENEKFKLMFYSTELFNIRNGFYITLNSNDSCVIEGVLCYKMNNVQGNILIKEVN